MKKMLFLVCFVLSIHAHTLKQKTDNLEQLLKEAQETQDRIVNILKNVPHCIEIINPGIKGIQTIERLLKTRNTADEITDYSRLMIVVENLPSVYWCLEELKRYVDIISVDDHFLFPFASGYRDINVVFKDPENDHIGEIQINTRAIKNMNDVIGRILFDKIRLTQAREKLENRPLTQDELYIIGDLTKMNKMAYETAFQRSYEAIRLGIYGICIRNGKILMVRTLCGDKYIYNFPGGGLEEGESLSDCLIRECKEELGCEITIENLLATSDRLYESTFFKKQGFNVYYNINVLGSVNGEPEGATWFDLDKLPLNMMLENDKDLINKIKNK